jgi:hypothetical protein
MLDKMSALERGDARKHSSEDEGNAIVGKEEGAQRIDVDSQKVRL